MPQRNHALSYKVNVYQNEFYVRFRLSFLPVRRQCPLFFFGGGDGSERAASRGGTETRRELTPRGHCHPYVGQRVRQDPLENQSQQGGYMYKEIYFEASPGAVVEAAAKSQSGRVDQ